MKRFTDAGRASIKSGTLYAALSLALTLPDICGSLEDPGPGKSKRRYERWCEQWFDLKYRISVRNVGDPTHLRPEDIFQLRCSLIHSGSAEVEIDKRTKIDRFVFFDETAGEHASLIRNVTFGGQRADMVVLSADAFSQQMFESVDKWDAAMVSDPKVQAEKEKLLFIHSAGATIHGITFS